VSPFVREVDGKAVVVPGKLQLEGNIEESRGVDIGTRRMGEVGIVG